jgi:hypothetical protein
MAAFAPLATVCKAHTIGSADQAGELTDGTIFTAITINTEEVAAATGVDSSTIEAEMVFIQPRMLSPEEPGANYNDQFAVRVRSIRYHGFVSPGPPFWHADIAIRRLDQPGGGWGGRLYLDAMWVFRRQ